MGISSTSQPNENLRAEFKSGFQNALKNFLQSLLDVNVFSWEDATFKQPL